jgi:trehalose 6-phosphate phosphatase
LANSQTKRIDLDKYEAAILDMDGVITRSARAHMAAWKRMFDDYLRKWSERKGQKFSPFTEEDYYQYVDGKPRYEGAQSFLASRGISLEYGSPEDPPEKESICGLGNRKNQYFREYLKNNGVESYQSTIDFINNLKSTKKRVAVISSSRNAKAVLEAARVSNLFHVVVDGVISAELHLKGKPEPDIFLEAAKRLGVNPRQAIVIEDAISGVEAGRAGGFGLVIGINRSGENTGLKDHGADMVISDLSELRSG